MWLCVCVGVCLHGFCDVWFCVFVDFVMFGYFDNCFGCFGNICACIYCVVYCLSCVFGLILLCIFIPICFVCTTLRSTATE